MLLWLVISLIPIFNLPDFKLQLGVGNHFAQFDEENSMERLKVGRREGDGIRILGCSLQTEFQGEEGVLQLQAMNLAVLTKWVYRLMSPEVDLGKWVLENNHRAWMDWERCVANSCRRYGPANQYH